MAFFEINGQEWELAEGSAQDPDEQVGGSTRTQSGDLRWRIRARKRSWSLQTSEYDRAKMDDFRDVLTDPDPLSISGDWFSATAFAELGQEVPVPGDAGLYLLSFRLVEV